MSSQVPKSCLSIIATQTHILGHAIEPHKSFAARPRGFLYPRERSTPNATVGILASDGETVDVECGGAILIPGHICHIGQTKSGNRFALHQDHSRVLIDKGPNFVIRNYTVPLIGYPFFVVQPRAHPIVYFTQGGEVAR